MKPAIHLEGKTAIITGASRGIGEATALMFAAHGAKVVLASRKQEGLDAVAEKVKAAGGEALPFAAHMGQPEGIKSLFDKAIETYGQVDVLVNNAATNPHFGPMMMADDGVYNKTFEVNTKGYYEASRALIAHLREREAPGAIVNVASVAGLNAAPMQGIYSMTKAAVISMTKNLAFECGANNIRVNAIAPGLIDTKLSAAITGNDMIRKMIEERTPLARVGNPEEIASGILYLASDAASFITGEVLVMDGGLTIN